MAQSFINYMGELIDDPEKWLDAQVSRSILSRELYKLILLLTEFT